MAIFQQNNPNEKDDQNKAPNQPQGGAAPITGPATVNTPPAPNAARQGSGRFTNIQSYLNANKGAGQQLAQGVSGQVQKKVDPAKKQTESYNEQVKSGIQSAQNTLNQGQNQLGQLSQIGQNIQANTGGQFYGQDKDFGINQFTQSPDFAQFQKIQAGQGVNEDTMNLQQQAFQNQANQFNKLSQDQANLASTEGGRFNLLKQSFGGNVNPQYSQGQQRLDQMFLQRQGLGDLRQNLNQNVDASRGLQAQAQDTGKNVRLAREQEQALMGNIDTTSKANEDSYVKMLESFVPEVNNRREQEFTSMSDRYKAMGSQQQAGGLMDLQRTDKNGNPISPKAVPEAQARQGLSADDLKTLGLSQNRQMFDVFDKTDLGMVADRGRQAQGFKDAATQKDVDLYGQLANIAKLDQGNRRVTQAADLGKAVLAKTGSANLDERLKQAADTFYNTTAAQDKLSSNARKDYHNQLSGKSWGTVMSDIRDPGQFVNLKQILSGTDLYGADRKMGGAPIQMADKAYKAALASLQNQNAGKVLTTEGSVEDALSGVNAGVTKALGNQGNWNKGQLHKFSTNLDEDFFNNLEKYGIKNPYKS